MKKCAKCGKVSEDGKVWILRGEKQEKTGVLEIMYCQLCEIQLELDFYNLLFWRKNNELH